MRVHPVLSAASAAVLAVLSLSSTARAESRFRWEVGAAGGPLAIDGGVGGVGGLHLQLGVQGGSVFAFYYQGVFGGGAAVGKGGYIQYNSAVFEATLLNHFQFGVGPSYDVIRVGLGSSTGAEEGYRGYFGAVGRLGLAIGGDRGRYRRGGLLLGVEVHPTFATDAQFTAPTAILFTIGGGQY